MDSKQKYLIYKAKYLYLKNQMKFQKGGTIEDVYTYLQENINKIDPFIFEMIHEYADSLLENNKDITVENFILNIKTNYGFNLPPPKSQPIQQPQKHLMLNFGMDRGASVARQDSRIGDLITVYTTGTAYFENDRPEYVRAFIENIVETCERAGKRVRFIHYDKFDNSRRRPEYYRDERFINGYLTLDIIRAEIENNPNALLVDIAHIIHYYRNPDPHQTKPIMIYRSYEENESELPMDDSMYLNINSFYPGFIGDMESMDYLRNFRFFQFENNNIITYIQKGMEKYIYIREIYRGDRTTLYDFISVKIHMSSLITNVRSVAELNDMFWS